MKSRPATGRPPARPQAPPAGVPDSDLEGSLSENLPPAGLTILVVDNDLGFLFWLGCILFAAGHVTLPAVNGQDASELLRRLNVEIDVLVVNYSMPGASELAVTLSRTQRYLKVVALVSNEGEPRPAVRRPDASRYRRSAIDEPSEAEWLEAIEGVFACSN